MRIAFIFADYGHKKFEEDIDVVSREFGVFPPLGNGFAAAIAERAGHETLLVDAHAEHLSPAEVAGRLRSFDPQALGFLCTAYMFPDTLRTIRALKAETGLPVIAGNVAMELYPREVMSFPEIDYGIFGSALDALPALLDALERGAPVPDVPGLCHKRDGELVVNRPAFRGDDFTRLPIPKRDGLPHHLYHAAMSKRRNVTNMVTAKGCPAACSFCHIHGVPYSVRPADGVVEEMVLCAERFGVREFEIFDPSFTIDRERIIRICQGIVAQGLEISFAVRARVDQVDHELLAWMARAGCARILYGLESGSQAMLDQMKKGITLDQIRRAVGMTRELGIKVIGFFLVGSPGETEATVDETVRFALDLGIEYAQFHKTMPKPGTELNRKSMAVLGRDFWREYVLGKVDDMRLPAPWTEMDQREVERLTIRAYHRFYMRPTALARTVLGVKSGGELLRYMRSGVGLLTVQSDLD